mmetsp:Transcript_21219/g.25694  ORF Transcript_21219/g.25694 Transcript_21219/m.25694 type:complete len:264 (-) Transcript_21219:1011-1802(-)
MPLCDREKVLSKVEPPNNNYNTHASLENGGTDMLEIVSCCTDSRYVEHDCYKFLCIVMKGLRFIFAPAKALRTTETEDEKLAQGLQLEQRPVTLMKRLEHIQHVLLQRTDPLLAAKLHMFGVEPHMFLIRWVRVLLAREVSMPQLLLIWDGIFSHTPNDFSLVDSLCVALLTERSYRQRIISTSRDHVTCLKILKRVPRFEEDQVGSIVYKAIKIHNEYEQHLRKINRQIKLQLQQEVGASAELEFVDKNSFESRFQREFFPE